MLKIFAKETLKIVVVLAFMLTLLWAMATQPFVGSSEIDMNVRADPEILYRHVVMLSKNLPPRNDNPLNLDKSARYIFDEFSKYGEAELLQFDVRGTPFINVSLKIDGESKESIIVGAHYDSFRGLPGADDNASGVAGILELARMFHFQKPPVTVILVAYALEEPPYFGTELMGSSNHAVKASKWSKPPMLMISLESIGYFNDSAGSQAYPFPWLSYLYSDTADFIAIVGRWSEIMSTRRIKAAFLGSTSLKVYSLSFLPIIPGMTLSDHSNYWYHDIDAVMVTDTAFERNKHYHTSFDTADTLDYVRMADVVNGTFGGVVLIGRESANGP